MRFIGFFSLLLLLGLYGCSSPPSSPRSSNTYPPPITIKPPLTKTSDKLTPSENFHSNDGYYRALFNMNSADCKSNNSTSGVYIVKLHDQSVVRMRGGLPGDKVIQIGAHKPRTSSELTYIIKRITPDTVVPIVLERSGRTFEIIVIPPPWEPTEQQKQQIDSPYQFDVCSLIGMMKAN